MKKFLGTSLILFIFYALTAVNFASAQTAVQKAFENVKGKLDELVGAKDEDSVSDLTLRIETFKKVIELSISEAKDLKLKLLALDKLSKELADWQKTMIEKLNFALDYYEGRKEFLIDNARELNLPSIRELAQGYKTWREEHYLKTADQIRDLLLIQQEQKSIQVANRRAQKIAEDLKKIEKAKIKGAADLNKLLAKAQDLIKEGVKLNDQAYNQFLNQFISFEISNSAPVAGETPEITAVATSSTSTLPEPEATSTEVIFQPSIKDLVRESLNKIKEAYQVFIEMSNLVRKLLK